MASVRSWITALRLRTLPLALAGWLVGTSIAAQIIDISLFAAVLTLITAFLLQILSNLANDYGDAVSGVDSDQREGPSRMVQSGMISKREMGIGVVICAVITLIIGMALLYFVFKQDFAKSLIFLALGVLGIAAAIKYTVGKNPYGYAGFGDLFVFVFFGIVLVFGTYYLQVQSLDWLVLLPASSIGLLSIGVLNVNNIRDIASDKAAGKHSIPVRIGKENAVKYHAFLLVGALVCAVIFSIRSYQSWTQFIFLIVSLLFIKNLRAVSSRPSTELDPYLKQMAISTLLFSVLFSLGLGLASIF